ncbi:MAG: hypothetical protein ACRDFX_12425, partial [Chloroflexota bacterium]
MTNKGKGELPLVAGTPDPLAVRLAGAFEQNHHELYLVGGSVRDSLLGAPGTDLDFATSALPAESFEMLKTLRLGSPYRIGERFGTIGT